MARKPPAVAYRFEDLELPDGDVLRLAWVGGDSGPVVLVLHGLEGSHDSNYARGLMAAVERRGWRGVVMNFRGCGGLQNRLPRAYHSGDTADVAAVVERLRARPGLRDAPLAVVGYSLGGNVLVKWLGEQGDAHPASCAVAVSVPYDLARSAHYIGRGVSRVYQRRLVRSLQDKALAKGHPPAQVRSATDFFTFDDRFTAPLHGFASAADYYRRASSGPFVAGIRIPTLLLHADDDPFMPSGIVPASLPPAVQLELSAHGGHVGFVTGSPWAPRYWLEERIPAFLASQWGAGRPPIHDSTA